MEILNKGSFVPLDNRERMGQMIFTAKTFAAEIAKNAGFQYNDPTNQQLALEIWKGSEYMTRAHEEATIKNLFLSNFLKELDGVVKETKGVPVSALPQPIAAPPSVETSVSGNIEETVKTVESGALIAEKTAGSLNESTRVIQKTVTLIDEIAKASSVQANAIAQIKQGVEQISSVVQTNAATAEESAASSEELSEQSSILQTLIAQFNLR